jgi:type II secretory pathway component PulC
MRTLSTLSIAIAACALGCGASQPKEAPVAAATDAGPAPEAREPGVIPRDLLRALLAEGPAALLARATTEPARTDGRFVGFRVTAFPKGPPQVVDLRVGDVIVAANGRNVGHYDVYLQVFGELGVASELKLEIVRDGQPVTLVYPIR